MSGFLNLEEQRGLRSPLRVCSLQCAIVNIMGAAEVVCRCGVYVQWKIRRHGATSRQHLYTAKPHGVTGKTLSAEPVDTPFAVVERCQHVVRLALALIL